MFPIMRVTKWKCRFMYHNKEYIRRIYSDIDGDWFIRFFNRYWEYESFTEKHYCSRWEEVS